MGSMGKTGTIQGLLEMLNIPYVGAGVLASSCGMDKVYSKIIFEKANIPQTRYAYIKHVDNKFLFVTDTFEEKEENIDKIAEDIAQKIKFFMKYYIFY